MRCSQWGARVACCASRDGHTPGRSVQSRVPLVPGRWLCCAGGGCGGARRAWERASIVFTPGFFVGLGLGFRLGLGSGSGSMLGLRLGLGFELGSGSGLGSGLGLGLHRIRCDRMRMRMCVCVGAYV